MTDRLTKMVNGLLPDGTLIRACEVTFGHLEKQDDRIAELKAALRAIVQVWDTDQPVSIARAALARDAARKALEGKDG
jgi:hypothetical protein